MFQDSLESPSNPKARKQKEEKKEAEKKVPEKNREKGLKPVRRAGDLRVLQHGRAVVMHDRVSLAASRWLFRGSI